MKKVIYIFLTVQSISLIHNCSYAQSNLNSVKVEFVGFNIETIMDVSCEAVNYTFNDDEKKISSFSDKADLLKFQSLLKDFKPIKAKRSFDVRGMIFFNYGNASDKYCFGVFGCFYKEGKFYYNKPLLIYLTDKLFSNHPEYLDTLRQQ
jgi:hypothetical protein